MRIPVGERGGVATWRASDGAASLVFMPKDGTGVKQQEQGNVGVVKGGGSIQVGDGDGSREAQQQLEDLDSLRQSLLGAEEGRGDGAKWEGDAAGDR